MIRMALDEYMNPVHSPYRMIASLPQQLKAVAFAFLATLVALPANAGITVPTEPIQVGGRVAPNILFVLDDSGSMAYTYMPDSVPNDWRRQAYPINSIHYNPAITYQTWMRTAGDGARMTGGTTYTDAYSDPDTASGAINLQGETRTFYVAINPAGNLNSQANYYRYQIHTDGRIVRSQYGTGTLGLADRGCGTSSTSWGSCTYALPSARSEADERNNYATWYSYHRTRMKVAKAGVGEAFSDVGSNLRVGLRTIHRRTLSGNVITQDNPLLISRNSGLFVNDGANDNRTEWYKRLYGATSSGDTPLRDALNRAGQYFQSSAKTGPWGPEEGINQLSCRQNFTLLTTDGYTNETSYTNPVGEQDNTAGTAITGELPGQTYTYSPGNPYSSAYGDNLGDVAMRYWKNDLRTDLVNNVRTSSANPAFWQHMVTFAISIGAAGTLNPETDLPAITAGTKFWPNPGNNNPKNIDDLWHAAVNGRGEFVLANDPTEFTAAMRRALSTILERTGSFSNLATSSGRVDSNTRSFLAHYISGQWIGDLRAFAVTSTGVDTSTPLWSAAAGIPATNRQVFTHDGTNGSAFPTSDQVTALARTTTPAVTGAENAAYIVGDRSKEQSNPGGTLRNRSSLFGDVINSSPVYDAREETIYVGANDGMLHAIDANDGSERFAYVPAGVNLADLASLSDPYYEHRYFVDGAITLSTRVQTPNKTVLVGALGRGGKGIYTLDVTSPDAFDAGDVMWERSETPGNNMGLVLGRPIITKLNNGVTGVIVPNGINSAGDRAALLIYNLNNGALLAEINTGVGNAANPNGLFSATVRDVDGNGTADTVYAGDMQGNLWRFNISSGSASTWSAASNRVVMYTAVNAAGQRQPITAAPALATDPASFQTWVFFGSGRFITEGDLSSVQVQTMYGMKDSTTTIAGRAALQRRAIVAAENGYRAFEAPSNLGAAAHGWYIDLLDPPNPPGTANGERVVSNPQVMAGILIFPTIVPSDDPCLPGGRGYLNILNAFTGASLATSFVDIDKDGDFDDERISSGPGQGTAIGSIPLDGMGTLPSLIGGVTPGGGGGGGGGLICQNINGEVICLPSDQLGKVGRVSWREIIRD